MTADNLDLRRRRKELNLSLDDAAALLYGRDKATANVPALSRFERGKRTDLPGGKTRKDFERVLDAVEMGRKS